MTRRKYANICSLTVTIFRHKKLNIQNSITMWKFRTDINDPDNCGGNSNSFIEGCESYVEEQE
jgi:hypothetical protein